MLTIGIPTKAHWQHNGPLEHVIARGNCRRNRSQSLTKIEQESGNSVSCPAC